MPMTYEVSLSEMCEFFEYVYGQEWPGQIRIEFYDIYKSVNKDSGKTVVRSTKKDEFGISSVEELRHKEILALNAYQERGFHFFFTVCPTDYSAKRKMENVVGAKCLWVDVDHLDQEQLQSRLQGIPIPPNLIVRSGGGFHLYWILDGFYEPDDQVKAACKKVHRWIKDSDYTHDLTRLLRIPGTWNFGKHKDYAEPYRCEIIHRLPGAYALEEFTAASISFSEIRLPEDFKEKYIKLGDVSLTSEGDRSHRDFAIIKELLLAGHTEEEIIEIYSNPLFGCSDKVIEKGPIHGPNYIKLTIKNARIEVVETSTGGIYDNGKIILKKTIKSNGMVDIEKLSNFVIIPHSVLKIVGTTEEYTEVTVTTMNGRSRRFSISPEYFTQWGKFLQKCNLVGMSFTGGSIDWQKYISYIFEKDLPENLGADVIGWHEKSFVLPEETLFDQSVAYITTGKIAPKFSFGDSSEFNPDVFMEELGEKLKQFRPAIAFPLFGWLAAVPFAPFVRKKYYEQFPLFTVDGEPGSGKTTIVRWFIRTFFGITNDHSVGDSMAIIRRAMGGTNATPTYIDEYEHNRNNKNLEELNAYLRLAFQASSAQKVSLEKEGSDDMAMVSPIVLTSSRGIKDDAIQDRTYIAHAERLPVYREENPTCNHTVELDGTAYACTRCTSRIPQVIWEGRQVMSWLASTPQGSWLKWWLTQDLTKAIGNIKEYRSLISGSDRRQFAFGVSTSFAMYCSERWNWGLTVNDFMNWYDHNTATVVVAKPEHMIDLLLARLFDSKKLMFGLNAKHMETGDYVCIKSEDAITEMLLEQSILSLPHYLDRSWFNATLTDMTKTGFLKERNKPTKINASLVRCIWLELYKFPFVMESLYGLGLIKPPE